MKWSSKKMYKKMTIGKRCQKEDNKIRYRKYEIFTINH